VSTRIRVAPDFSREVAYGLTAVRIANGCLLLASPRLASLLYLGPGGRTPTAKALGRFVGARDVLTGALAAVALTTKRGDVEIVRAAACIEGADAVLSLFSRGVSLKLRAASVTAMGASVVGAWAAQGLARQRTEESTRRRRRDLRARSFHERRAEVGRRGARSA
jgi:hypothetical protein